jgi:hypothetical protein
LQAGENQALQPANALKKFSPIKMPDRADYRAFERNFFPVFSGTPLAKGNSGPPNCAANEQLKFESHEHA